jgi:hypothetical protein
MKIETMFLVLLVGAILLVGCTQQPEGGQPSGGTPAGQAPGGAPAGQPPANQTPPPANQTPPPQANQTPAPPTSTGIDQIYRFGSVHSYEYKITSTAGGQTTTTNFKTAITSDTVNGVAAWLQQTDMTTQGTSITSKTWIDKITYKCLKTMSVMSYGGQTIEQPGQCPTEGPNSASRTEAAPPSMTYIGSESVTVPAGTYTCDKYSLEQVTYWSTSSVPIPVKVAYSDGSTTMELVSYT